MKQLVPLLTLAFTAPSAMASNTNDIWSYQDSDGTTLAQACNNKRTCELIYKTATTLPWSTTAPKRAVPLVICWLPNTPVAALRNWIPAPAAPRPVSRSIPTID